MEASIVSREDMNYLAQQSAGKLNMILSGMTALLNDNENKVNMLESQTWFQRMARTLTGKNKMAQQEIQRNHDRMNLYMSQAMTALYEQNCIDHQIMMSLGNQINGLYAEHLQLKQMLGAFASKLNEKIESIDNFHILVTEIEQGVYSDESAIISVCKIMAQLDKRTALDDRKRDILYRGMQQQGILDDTEKPLGDYLLEFTEIGMESIGAIYLELESIRDNYMAGLLLKLIEGYHFLPDMARKLKNKQSVVEEIIRNENLDSDIRVTTQEVYQDFVTSKMEMLDRQLPAEQIQDGMMLEDAEKLFLECRYKEALECFESLSGRGNGRAMYFLGLYYEGGYETKYIDKEKAKKYFCEGEKNGDVLAAYMWVNRMEVEKEERQQRYKEIKEEILNLAQTGDIFAQRIIGEMFAGGYGVPVDYESALDYYMKSADGGCCEAMNLLGTCYVYGKSCTKKDEGEAAQWYKKAADRGYARGQANWGLCNKLGVGVEKNGYEAVRWDKKAAEQGDATGQNNLGTCYSDGVGVEKDEYEAVKWYRKAVEQGDGSAQCNLAGYYANGRGGLVKDEYEAVKWYRKAAENGSEDARKKLSESYGIHIKEESKNG
ncbi:hypothetical protein GN277_07555 [Lachnospiraceae bacterium WCA-9-b2]|uniref:Sel1 repeat family protein n=1 Tax=Sporofaciens musculi TaxID=2681861 RepID=A0A7X3MFE9_9FIRM|nr:tetratricopeptide repeat protein [Sporofaciens musculi]MXP75242.1 hypothetical protein [Sporofaciens musculi]